MAPRVGIRVDGWPEIGVGHVVRCLALAEELLTRGAQVHLLGEVRGVPWLEQALVEAGLRPEPAPADPDRLAGFVREAGLDAVVLDGYHLARGTGRALRAAGVVVLALADGEFGAGQDADLLLDQNLGATPREGLAAEQLVGARYALIRDAVLAHRDTPPPGRTVPRVLTVFGGTDPQGAAEVVVPLVLASDAPCEVVAVAASDAVAERLARCPLGPGQRVLTRRPDPDLAAVAVTCDLAVTAAGSSVWELLVLGVPTAVVGVVENQRLGFDAVARSGAAVPVGFLDALRSDPDYRTEATSRLRALLLDPDARRRLRDVGRELVDGDGRVRVVDALFARLARSGTSSTSG